jgi:hypothetical protein
MFNPMLRRYSVTAGVFAVCAAGALFAQTAPERPPLAAGDVLSRQTCVNQHDESSSLDETLKGALFVSNMDASKILHAVLQPQGDEFLKSRGLRVVADISRMPAIISRLVAVPRMREYSYSLCLIREIQSDDPWPRRPGEVLLIELDNLKVRSISSARNEAELRALLKL